MLYDTLHSIHYTLSRVMIGVAIALFVLAFIQAQRKRDAGPWIRKAAYAITALVITQVVLGFMMYFQGGRPLEPDVHMVYGIGASVVLPFFVYVELTAEKRPAIGSYILGGLILLGLVIRGIFTGS